MKKPAVEIKNLSKTYASGTVALKSINLEIQSGDFFALLGSNGAGKTTIINILTSLVTKTSGQIKVFGYDLDTQINSVKNSIGVVPQEFNFNIFEKVIDIVVRQGGYYGMREVDAKTKAEEILKKLELWGKKDAKSQELSGGMKRRLMIARALIHSPKLLILDEPTAGVDAELRRGMWEYLIELNKSGTTILLTTHYLEEVEELCKNAAMIKKGEIILNESVKKLLTKLDKEVFTIVTKKSISDKLIKKLGISGGEDNFYDITVDKNSPLQKYLDEISSEKNSTISVKPRGNRIENLFLSIVKS